MRGDKNIIFIILVLYAFPGLTQKKFVTTKGEINFTSNAKLEVIKAASNKVQGIIDPTNEQFAFIVKIQSFEGFNSNLQQQHFNERYMETDKYYDATFSGKIIEPVDFSNDGIYDVNAKGVLIIHGVKQLRIIPGKLKIEKGILQINSNFAIPLADHNIKIPTLVNEKIATEILVSLNIQMVQK